MHMIQRVSSIGLRTLRSSNIGSIRSLIVLPILSIKPTYIRQTQAQINLKPQALLLNLYSFIITILQKQPHLHLHLHLHHKIKMLKEKKFLIE